MPELRDARRPGAGVGGGRRSGHGRRAAPGRCGAGPGAGGAQRAGSRRGLPRGHRRRCVGPLSVCGPRARHARGGPGRKGWSVDRVTAYRTVSVAPPGPEVLARVAAADAVVFTASSSVQAFAALRQPDGAAVRAPAPCGLHRARPPPRPPVPRVRRRSRGAGGVDRRNPGRAGRALRPRPRQPVVWSAMAADAARPSAAPAHAGTSGFPARRLRRLRRTPGASGGSWPRPASVSTTWWRRCSCARASTRPPRSRRCRARSSTRSTRSSLEAKRLASLGVPGLILFGVPAAQGRTGQRRLGPRRASCRWPCAPCATRWATSSS